MLVLSAAAASRPVKYDIHTAPFHPRIHNFGNTGFFGAVHAASAPLATKIIDLLAYDGRNMRRELAELLVDRYAANSKVVEVGCGVGTLTRELQAAGFVDVTALDTSKQMIAVATAECAVRAASAAAPETPEPTFVTLNAVEVGERFPGSDVAIACMLVHELPQLANYELLKSLIDATAPSGDVWIVDIAPTYKPSPTMLSGEPFVLEYLSSFQEIVRKLSNHKHLKYKSFELVPGHVIAHVISRKTC